MDALELEDIEVRGARDAKQCRTIKNVKGRKLALGKCSWATRQPVFWAGSWGTRKGVLYRSELEIKNAKIVMKNKVNMRLLVSK